MRRLGEVINCRKIANEIVEETRKMANEIKKRAGVMPCLASLFSSDDEGVKIYLKQEKKFAREIGISIKKIKFDGEEIFKIIDALNSDEKVHGILIHRPLPNGLSLTRIASLIDERRDVEGISPISLGRIVHGEEKRVPCTAGAVMRIVENVCSELIGKNVVIINHSLTVGKPLALMFLNRNSTVNVCHVYTKNLKKYTSNADVLVVAAGVPKLVKRNMIKKGAVIVDVGMNRVEGKICGDVDFDDVLDIASAITPVPGGVGPVTVATLMKNVCLSALRLLMIRH